MVKVVKAALSVGHDPPQAFTDDRPDLWPICEPYWRAFWALSAGRELVLGYGVGMQQPLPYTEISQYARDHGIQPGEDEFTVFVGLIRVMDSTFRAEWQKKNAKPSQ